MVAIVLSLLNSCPIFWRVNSPRITRCKTGVTTSSFFQWLHQPPICWASCPQLKTLPLSSHLNAFPFAFPFGLLLWLLTLDSALFPYLQRSPTTLSQIAPFQNANWNRLSLAFNTFVSFLTPQSFKLNFHCTLFLQLLAWLFSILHKPHVDIVDPLNGRHCGSELIVNVVLLRQAVKHHWLRAQQRSKLKPSCKDCNGGAPLQGPSLHKQNDSLQAQSTCRYSSWPSQTLSFVFTTSGSTSSTKGDAKLLTPVHLHPFGQLMQGSTSKLSSLGKGAWAVQAPSQVDEETQCQPRWSPSE